MKFLKKLNWTDTVLRVAWKQAVHDMPVWYHDIFAGHRMDIGMNTEFKVKLRTKNDKAVYRQNLPIPIHFKEPPIVKLALMHENAHYCSFQNTLVLFLRRKNPVENYAFMWISREITL